jgi:Nif-specific regulatory protein
MALSELSDYAQWSGAGWNLVAVPAGAAKGTTAVLCAYFRHRDPSGFAGRLSALDVVASLMWKAARSGPAAEPDPRVPEPATARAKAAFEYSNMIGSSVAMRQVYEQIGQVARTNATALLRGESGTGKELAAKAIHDNSTRASMPFVKVNCAALPEPLFESELFGHERGAFTGAHSRKKGRFEMAHGGTLFLDEIGELSLTTQAKLLRVLQFREFERLGGVETIHADTRIVAATNQDLERAVRAGTFREDLYYRINVFTITLPPLRARPADIPALAEFFLTKLAAEHERRITRISSAAMDFLTRHSWPGNVRELENVIERAVVMCDGSVLEERHLPQPLVPSDEPVVGRMTLDEAVEQLERRMIEDALRAESGNIAAAARLLDTTERILRYKAQKLGLDTSRYRR